MSDIPRAREILQQALVNYGGHSPYDAIIAALALLDRKKPKYVAPRQVRKLSLYNADYARHLRKTGMSLNEIAVKLKSNIGRVSEACA